MSAGTTAFSADPTPRVLCRAGALDQLGRLAGALGARRLFLVTDPGLLRAGLAQRAACALERAGIDCVLFSQVGENPTTRHVEAGTDQARRQGPFEAIAAVGGGSAMDCAKGVNFLLTNGGAMEDYWGHGKAAQPMLPSLGVPTTAGTGSEAQSYALIAQADTHRKMACGDPKARFHTVVLDPDLIASTPSRVAGAAGFDAIAHALESFVSTRANPFSRLYAREAWRLLNENLETYLDRPDRAVVEVRSGMLLGAHWAGAAIEASMLGAAHACANPLTADHGLSHGMAVALMLPHVIAYNADEVAPLYAELAQSAGLAATVAALLGRLDRLRRAAGLPARLRDVAIAETDLSQLAAGAAEQWTAQFNPRPVDTAQLYALYRAAF